MKTIFKITGKKGAVLFLNLNSFFLQLRTVLNDPTSSAMPLFTQVRNKFKNSYKKRTKEVKKAFIKR